MTHLRIILTEEQSAAVREYGITFAVLGNGSYLDAVQRGVLYMFPCTQQQAQAACDVAMGNARAVPVKSSQNAIGEARADSATQPKPPTQ